MWAHPRAGPLQPRRSVTEARPKVYSIAAGTPFLDSLAEGILARHGRDPMVLGRVTVLLPTRRAARAMRESFLRTADGAALMLPAIRTLGDIDEDELAWGDPAWEAAANLPPAIEPLRRHLLLARLVQARADLAATPGMAARLAQTLGDLLDSIQTEGVDLAALDNLVPADFAEHWQRTLEFLRIIRVSWPALLDELGVMDAAERRRKLTEALAARWQSQPPTDPVYAAGSTGSIPATAALLKVIARLPEGAVVLAGFDPALDVADWVALADNPTHPQFGFRQLFDRIAIDCREVEPWPGGKVNSASPRARMIGDALRPAETTDTWTVGRRWPDEAFAGLHRIDCIGPQHEATVIALLMRETLEQPEKTAALVTPDRALARRVAAELKRWDVEVDDSAGVPLAETPPAVFLRLTATLVAEDAAPLPLLAALKHPLACGGERRHDFLRRVRRLERLVLRGPRPAPGLDGLRMAVAELGEKAGDLLPWLGRLTEAARPLVAAMAQGLTQLVNAIMAHVGFAEWLARSEEGTTQLWHGDAGEALANFVAELIQAAPALDEMRGRDWPDLLDALMIGRVVRPRFGRHPRLHIWGLLEARLQQADRLILSGLNEGTWPPEPAEDPWLSRPMRHQLGLPSPERRIGLTAHDFVQAATASEAFLTRAGRVEGAPGVPSRWLMRLDAMLAGDERWNAAGRSSHAGWAPKLDDPETQDTPKRPRPTPPVEARPRKLSVTRVETWIRDPYAIFAGEVLGLKPLDPIDAAPDMLERGRVLHRALDEFLRAHRESLPDDALMRLIAAGEAAFGSWLERPAVRTFWWPRFLRIADWFIRFERERRAAGYRTLQTEFRGAIELPGPAGPFELTARADRIDLAPGGTLEILDYKTGVLPSVKQVASGLAPQLPLEGVIAARGGFAGIAPAAVGELAHVRLSGGEPAGKLVSATLHRQTRHDPEELVAKAEAGLRTLIADYDKPNTPYLSQPRPQWLKYAGNYDHLARVLEWRASGEDQ